MAIKLENLKITQITDTFKDQVCEILYFSKHNEPSQREQDRMWTALKRMPYDKFSCIKSPDGTIYLSGKTEDIEAKINGHHYNIGPYHVLISKSSIMGKQLNPIHLIPDYDPKTSNRHLHHYGSIGGQPHPLLYEPRWCWASIGPSYMSALHDTDIVDMFRLLYIFLIRLDNNSPLCSAWKTEAMSHGVPL